MAVRGSGAGCPIVFVWTCALSGASLCRVRGTGVRCAPLSVRCAPACPVHRFEHPSPDLRV